MIEEYYRLIEEWKANPKKEIRLRIIELHNKLKLSQDRANHIPKG